MRPTVGATLLVKVTTTLLVNEEDRLWGYLSSGSKNCCATATPAGTPMAQAGCGD